MNAASRAVQKIRDSLSANPVAWLLVGALLLCEWGNYQNGRDITRICELIELPAAWGPKPLTAREKIVEI